MIKALALIAGVALILNFYVSIKDRGQDSVPLAAWKYFSYFTVLTNILLCVWSAALGFFPESYLGRISAEANVAAAVVFYIVSVGVGNYLMFGIPRLKPLNHIADAAVHAVTPLAAFALWVGYIDKEGLSYAYSPYWLVYPWLYAAYTALHGTWTKFYPYPFTDVQALGAKRVALNALGQSICVFLGSLAFITLGKLLASQV